MTLTCFCCKQEYERGQFRCCAPPAHMKAFRWQEQFCREPISETEACNTCPRHACRHRAAQPLSGTELGMSSLQDVAPTTRGALVALAKQWMPYRETGEEG